MTQMASQRTHLGDPEPQTKMRILPCGFCAGLCNTTRSACFSIVLYDFVAEWITFNVFGTSFFVLEVNG